MDSVIVGVAGFEPATPCSQSRCANRTALHPECHSTFSAAKVTLFFELQKFFLFFFYFEINFCRFLNKGASKNSKNRRFFIVVAVL